MPAALPGEIATTANKARNGRIAAAALVASLAVVLWSQWRASLGGETKPPRKNVKLPGLVINFEERSVDLEGTVCLDEGMLELVACTKGSKEHESIVALTARPMHIHAALLLLGAKPGHPAMRKPLDKEGKRWLDVPPRGDPVVVSLVFEDKTGKTVERPISRFVAPAGQEAGDVTEDVKFPDTFVFAGSFLRENGSGPRTYLCDESGNVISISTFGDEVLCLPDIHSNANAMLEWQVDPSELPPVGTKVILRLRPRAKAVPRPSERQKPLANP